MKQSASRKHFVLDTNVLLHNPESINSFADNIIVLPMTVIEELDNFKRHNDELGRSARQVIRQLDRLRERGNLRDGVVMENGGTLKITVEDRDMPGTFMDMSVPDNRILAIANSLRRQGERVIFVSKDINSRLKADALGIDVMDFEKQKCDFDTLYTGWSTATVSTEQIDSFYRDEPVVLTDPELFANEFVLLQDASNPKHSALARVGADGSLVHLIRERESAWNIRARSKEQRMALELLLDPDICLITMIGRAGTGKTLLALAAGLECVLTQGGFEKLLVSRPIIPMGKDIGYLPGT